jgi:hypothetical protein
MVRLFFLTIEPLNTLAIKTGSYVKRKERCGQTTQIELTLEIYYYTMESLILAQDER